MRYEQHSKEESKNKIILQEMRRLEKHIEIYSNIRIETEKLVKLLVPEERLLNL